jgi:hypothetical protein
MATTEERADRDSKRLAELGYAQDLERSWSGFQNFAISFTIISVLAGCFTTYYQGWNNGGPVAIAWGWPIISAFILIIAFCMAELVSAFPTAGGIYWWASRLGGPAWGWFTGWFNLLGLIAITASVDYFAGQFLGVILGLYKVSLLGLNFGDSAHALRETFILFAIILSLHVAVNIGGSHLVARFNGISTTPASTAAGSAAGCSGSTCSRSASCSRSTRSPATTRQRTSPRRPTAPTSPRPRACGARCSTPRSSATSCCWRSRSRRPIRRP